MRRMGRGAVARQFLMALWRFLAPGVRPAGAVLTEVYALAGCGVTPRAGDWWRRPEQLPGWPSPPS